MIRIIIHKIIRLINFNRMVQLKIFGIIGLLVLTGVFTWTFKAKDKELLQADRDLALVKEIASMEKKLKTEKLKLLQPEKQIIAIQNILEGTSFKDETYQAIIDGEVYSTGDTIGDYEIINITMKTILLENSEIYDIKELSFPDQGPDPEELMEAISE